jgi:hypothetical protein
MSVPAITISSAYDGLQSGNQSYLSAELFSGWMHGMSASIQDPKLQLLRQHSRRQFQGNVCRRQQSYDLLRVCAQRNCAGNTPDPVVLDNSEDPHARPPE